MLMQIKHAKQESKKCYHMENKDEGAIEYGKSKNSKNNKKKT